MDVALSLPTLIHPKALSLPTNNTTLSLFPQQFILSMTIHPMTLSLSLVIG